MASISHLSPQLLFRFINIVTLERNSRLLKNYAGKKLYIVPPTLAKIKKKNPQNKHKK